MITFRPGRMKHEYSVDLPRPRVMEHGDVAHVAADILQDLRVEINKSLNDQKKQILNPDGQDEARS